MINVAVKGLNQTLDSRSFKQVIAEANRRRSAISQERLVLREIGENFTNPDVATAAPELMTKLQQHDLEGAIKLLKTILTSEDAAAKETSLGIAVMAKGWSKPIVFPKSEGFKWGGWADVPKTISTEDLWNATYGEKPSVILGAVGNSNIKPEQVKGGCSLTKQELSAKYEQSIIDFYKLILDYMEEVGVNTKKMGFAFAHSDCGVDKAGRKIVENHNLKGIATTPTEYTQYLRGKEYPPTEEFPDGYILADFPFPTILTRGISQINDYAEIYGKLVGKDNPIGIFGGGQHAFSHDTKQALFAQGSVPVPVDIMKERFGIVIPATNEKGDIINAARNYLERVDGNPYLQYRYYFNRVLPDSKLKREIADCDPQMAMTSLIYSKAAESGLITK